LGIGKARARDPAPIDWRHGFSDAFALRDGTYCYPVSVDTCVDFTERARSILSQWRLVYASMNPANFPCRPGRSPCTRPVGGLGVQIWVRRGAQCTEAVVAFRGTDRTSSEDWTSNLHWLLRLLPIYDQYEQVQDYAPEFVRAIERDPCFVKGKTQIVAVGHSLGGGLAQQAAYMDPRIRQVYAFRSIHCNGIERRARSSGVDPERARIEDRTHLRAR